MKKVRIIFSLSLATILSSCAFGPGSGMLASPAGPYNLDTGQLERNCDMEDSGACLLFDLNKKPELRRAPIIQGIAPPQQALFSAQLPLNFQGHWLLFHRATKELRPLPVMERYPGPNQIRMELVEATKLDPKETYELLLVDHLGQVVDHRLFKSSNYAQSGLRFAAISCLDDSHSEEQRVQWQDVQKQNPDAIFLLGDNVYLRKKSTKLQPLSRDEIWTRYAETRAKLDLYYWESLVPVAAVWDDNDYGGDDETNLAKEDSRWVHEVYFPLKADTNFSQVGPGTAKAISWAGQTFLFLDNRSFRTPDAKPPYCQKNPKHQLCQRTYARDSADASHFGRMQEEWALRMAQKNQPLWLISGDQWFGGYHPFDSFEGNHSANFIRFFEQLDSLAQKQKIPYAFLSGDRHLAEIITVRKGRRLTYEFTSSGLHARTYPDSWKEFPNPRKLLGFSGLVNYMIFDSKRSSSGDLDVQVDIRSLGNSLSKRTFVLHKK